MASPFCQRRHLAVLSRDKLNISRLLDGPPHEVLAISRRLEPAAVAVVATQVGIDDVRHGTGIARPGMSQAVITNRDISRS